MPGFSECDSIFHGLAIANLTNQTGSLAIHGPVSANTDSIPPGGTGSVKVNLQSGSYEASVDGIAVRPFQFTVVTPAAAWPL